MVQFQNLLLVQRRYTMRPATALRPARTVLAEALHKARAASDALTVVGVLQSMNRCIDLPDYVPVPLGFDTARRTLAESADSAAELTTPGNTLPEVRREHRDGRHVQQQVLPLRPVRRVAPDAGGPRQALCR